VHSKLNIQIVDLTPSLQSNDHHKAILISIATRTSNFKGTNYRCY